MNCIDLHCDTIMCLMDSKPPAGLYRNSLSVDIEKLRAAKAQAQFFAMFIDLQKDGDPLIRALQMIDRFYQELEQNRQYIAVARDYAELRQNQQAGKLSAFLTIEEGGALNGDLVNLRNFYRLGVRLITLTWNYPNELGYPNCLPECSDRGLTAFGREVVAEMNRLGMLIDVSHLSRQGFYDVAELTRQPFVASHSNAWAVTRHHRNVTDGMIRLLAEKGGVMGLNFEKSFLGEAPLSRVADMVAHIRHIWQVGGSEVIALGSDFDGISRELELSNSSEMNKLTDALAQNGFSQDDIEKICWKNALRVIKSVL